MSRRYDPRRVNFEYKLVNLRLIDEGAENTLNDLGADGWEYVREDSYLADIVDDDDDGVIGEWTNFTLFKRQRLSFGLEQ